jgi:hypothetical protein
MTVDTWRRVTAMKPNDSSTDSGHLPRSGTARRTWLTITAGLIAGGIAWLGGEACHDLIMPARHPVNSRGIILYRTFPREEVRADTMNAGLAFIILGSSLGAALGVAGGLVRRSVQAAIRAGLIGLASGAGAAGGASVVLLPLYNAYKERNPDEAVQDLLYPLLIHAGIWSTVGGVAGFAFAHGLGAGRRTPIIIQGAFAGAALGALGFEIIGALAVPAARTAQFVSTTWQTRLFARLAVTVLTAAGAAFAAHEVAKQSAPPDT